MTRIQTNAYYALLAAICTGSAILGACAVGVQETEPIETGPTRSRAEFEEEMRQLKARQIARRYPTELESVDLSTTEAREKHAEQYTQQYDRNGPRLYRHFDHQGRRDGYMLSMTRSRTDPELARIGLKDADIILTTDTGLEVAHIKEMAELHIIRRGELLTLRK